MAVSGEDVDVTRLKSLGICLGRRIQLVKGGDPLVVRVLGARVGLSRRLAHGVLVEQI
jgi:Fe2+ transport system protein FeoA